MTRPIGKRKRSGNSASTTRASTPRFPSAIGTAGWTSAAPRCWCRRWKRGLRRKTCWRAAGWRGKPVLEGSWAPAASPCRRPGPLPATPWCSRLPRTGTVPLTRRRVRTCIACRLQAENPSRSPMTTGPTTGRSLRPAGKRCTPSSNPTIPRCITSPVWFASPGTGRKFPDAGCSARISTARWMRSSSRPTAARCICWRKKRAIPRCLP